MNLPVKDNRTTPWVSEREIPAVKIVLSAWRKAVKRDGFSSGHKEFVATIPQDVLPVYANVVAKNIAEDMEKLMLIDERLRQEEGCAAAAKPGKGDTKWVM